MLPNVGEPEDLDAVGRKVTASEGLEALRLSRGGDGESSMMSTQPVESPPLSFLSDRPIGRFCSTLFLEANGFSQLDFPAVDLPKEVVLLPARGVVTELAFVFEVLPIRNLGTRVCIFCSKFLTLARISETICTPLLLDVTLALDVVAMEEGFLSVVGRVMGVRGELYIDGNVFERGMAEKLGGVEREDFVVSKAVC